MEKKERKKEIRSMGTGKGRKNRLTTYLGH